MTNKLTQAPAAQDPNASLWLAPNANQAIAAPKDDADKDDDDDDLGDEDDDDEFDDDEEDEDSDDAEESEEPA